MNPHRWSEIDRILQSALDLAPTERAAFLTGACAGDDELRSEVEALLAADAASSAFLAEPLLRPTTTEPTRTGQRIGAYRLISELGRGGMGTVYLAERADEQFQQQVALKLINRGMDTDEIVRRFRHERQILASLNYPHIARLLDGGTTDDERPYFVMEYIAGAPLLEYCDRQQLNLTARLELFLQVCRAVQHAHNNLIVHRDLKPSNILVTADGTVKLLDFGIAKWLNTEQAGASTVQGLRPMTLAYASPEQVRGAPVAPASDVYSLGVVLYELLTGRRPYQLTDGGASEAARIICEQEPVRPSHALLQATPTTNAAEPPAPARPMRRNRRQRQLRGDLDNIILQALRKEPARRYHSVSQFAEDIERHLTGLPVRARPDTFSYRASKFAQRHRAGLLAAALILLTLIGGIIATTRQARRARAQQAVAEQRFNDVRHLANAFLFDFHDAIHDLPGSLKARELVINKSIAYLDKLARDATHDPALQRELAAGYTKLGLIQNAGFGANASSGDSAGALASYRKALTLRQALAANTAPTTPAHQELAESYLSLATIQIEIGQTATAYENAGAGLALLETAVAAEPSNVQTKVRLMRAHRGFYVIANTAYHMTAAFSSLQRAKEIGEALLAEQPDLTLYLAAVFLNLGEENMWRGGTVAAEQDFQRAEGLIQEWLNKTPTSQAAQRMLFILNLRRAGLLLRGGNPSQALAVLSKSVAPITQRALLEPQNAQAQRDALTLEERISDAMLARNAAGAAIEGYRKNVAAYHTLANHDQANTRHERDLAEANLKLARALLAANQKAEAKAVIEQACAKFDGLLAQEPNNWNISRLLVEALLLNAELCAKAGRTAPAHDLAQRALALQEPVADHPEALGLYLNEYAWPLLSCAAAGLRNPTEALRYAKLAAERTRENDPHILKTLALAYHQTGDYQQAVKTAQKALALLPPREKPASVLRRELAEQLIQAQQALSTQL